MFHDARATVENSHFIIYKDLLLNKKSISKKRKDAAPGGPLEGKS